MYCIFKQLLALLKQLDAVLDIGGGHRPVRRAKYQIYNKTNNFKYLHVI